MKIWQIALAIVGLLLLVILALNASKAQAVSVTMLWTAPGDDGSSGRASQYDLRYSTAAISGTDTLSWWNAATKVLSGLPSPGVSGTTDSVQVLGLSPSTTYRFILKAADEVPNWSGYSNVAVVITPDQVAPGRVTDLRVRPF